MKRRPTPRFARSIKSQRTAPIPGTPRRAAIAANSLRINRPAAPGPTRLSVSEPRPFDADSPISMQSAAPRYGAAAAAEEARAAAHLLPAADKLFEEGPLPAQAPLRRLGAAVAVGLAVLRPPRTHQQTTLNAPPGCVSALAPTMSGQVALAKDWAWRCGRWDRRWLSFSWKQSLSTSCPSDISVCWTLVVATQKTQPLRAGATGLFDFPGDGGEKVVHLMVLREGNEPTAGRRIRAAVRSISEAPGARRPKG
jgi:hypothetical protein